MSIKNINRNIFDQVNKIFYAPTDFQILNELSQYDSFTIPLIIHQNIHNFFQYNLVDKDKKDKKDKKVSLLLDYYDK